MDLCKLVMQLGLVVLLLEVIHVVPAVAAQAKQGCIDQCGNVSIPYPFGVKRCNLNKDFLITCNQTSHRPYLRKSNIQVTNINITAGEMEILKLTASKCYDGPGNFTLANNKFTVKNFNISQSKNKFTVTGCNSYGYLNGLRDRKSYSAGCMTTCNSVEFVDSKSCSGSGCCQIEIPDWLSNITISVYTFNESIDNAVINFSRCSRAFVVEESKFNFSSQYLKDLLPERLPVVLDWAIDVRNITKEQGRALCKDNAKKYNPTNNTLEFRCKCRNGYQGNPYLGCYDINECENNTHNCTDIGLCKNTDGNYTCTCPNGLRGDGRKNGQGIGISFIALFVVSSWLYLVIKQRKLIKLKAEFFEKNGGLMLQQKLRRQDGASDAAKIFTAEELKKATNDYDKSTIVGKGGFAVVYKGILADDTEVAIKKSIQADQSQIEQFINEIVVLSQINHRNVVRLLGCCLETEVPLLVYEFIPSGALSKHIHDENKASALSWDVRLRIAAETAGALSYLHSEASVPIIHRDVKTDNILLDANHTAKVSDFGASRLVPLNEMVLCTIVQGTYGYLDPEYMQTSQLTEKSDVYSFGVVMVELLTTEKALCFERPEELRSLANYFLSSLKVGSLFEILDNRIVSEENKENIEAMARLAKQCLSVKGEERPSMREVAIELEGLQLKDRHPWVEEDSEETEYLLKEQFVDVVHADRVTSSSICGQDSIKNNVILTVGDGR